MIYPVKEWTMTKEQKEAYIKKHPIVPVGKPKGTAFAQIYKMKSRSQLEKEASNKR